MGTQRRQFAHRQIQSALKASSAIPIILSKHWINSAWCKKELSVGLMREIAEKKSLLMPCIIDDCEIPIFLQEKLYANFRDDPDKALNDINRALAGISNPLQGRTETPEFHIDWSVSWGTVDNNDDDQFIEFTFVDHAPNWPYIVMSQCKIMCNPAASRQFLAAQKKGMRELYIRDTLELIVKHIKKDELTMIIEDPLPKSSVKKITGEDRQIYHVEFSYRRWAKKWHGYDVHRDGNLLSSTGAHERGNVSTLNNTPKLTWPNDLTWS